MALTLEKKYQKKTDKEHILDNPDSYIGSIENVEDNMYVFDKDNNNIILDKIEYNPGLHKLFDEAIVNCRDHLIRMKDKVSTNSSSKPVTKINVTIQDDKFTFYNNGDGIDIEKHPTYDVWIPELIFGHLRTSTNYDKNEKKITGGKNGFGIKLIFIWSTYGKIETVDHTRQLKYTQEFLNNLDIIKPPKITKNTSEPYTQVEFIPDFKRLGIEKLSNQMISLFQRRVYDIAGITDNTVSVRLNKELIKSNNFDKYVKLYTNSDTITECSEDGRWVYSVCLSDEYRQISFVNGINTSKGGKHVDYIMNQITKKMIAFILKKKKIEVKASIIKEQLTIYLNSTIVNPSFDSQTKDYLNTPCSKFGSSCTVTDKFIEKLAKFGVLENSCNISDIKEKNKSKKSDGNKSKNIHGIPKLVDANYAGTKNSSKAILILCEGDSAKTGVLSGLSESDRNIYGVYPVKGKILNVRGETTKKINENNEICDIKKILGLVTGQIYKDTSTLRYGKVLFMTDQDLDGSHIKGLCINMFECLWPSLLEIDNFLGFMNTPIIKVSKNKKSIPFYYENDYKIWKDENDDKGWKVKYYKGLGTSTGAEFKEYFKEKKIMNICVEDDCRNQLDKVFNKKKASERKTWLENFDRNNTLNPSLKNISLSDFVNQEMIQFSKYDCERSIPNIMDGFKISQRKILFSCLKKNLSEEIKVSQLSGYVSENSGYHHGENSLNGAIINMAQTFIGSNNINLLFPSGQFGTRLCGGKDHAAERYIFTKLENITRLIFNKDDDYIIDYNFDDGLQVEPRFYIPIIPMVLINGASGIGTGFSTDIPLHCPINIIHFIINVLSNNKEDAINTQINPYYKGFKGKIIVNDNNFNTYGVYTFDDNKLQLNISELPINTWTSDFKKLLEKLYTDGVVKEYNDYSTDVNVDFNIILKENMTHSNIEKTFKLKSTISTSNMNLFTDEDKLMYFEDAKHICVEFIRMRLPYYEKRRLYLIDKYSQELIMTENKYKYVEEIIANTIDLRNKKVDQVNSLLNSKGYVMFDESYKYLTKMTMDSVCDENVIKLKNLYDDKVKVIEYLKSTNSKEMWIKELNELEDYLKS